MEQTDSRNWRAGVLDALSDPSRTVHFNLDGVDVWEGLLREASRRGGTTDWEHYRDRDSTARRGVHHTRRPLRHGRRPDRAVDQDPRFGPGDSSSSRHFRPQPSRPASRNSPHLGANGNLTAKRDLRFEYDPNFRSEMSRSKSQLLRARRGPPWNVPTATRPSRSRSPRLILRASRLPSPSSEVGILRMG